MKTYTEKQLKEAMFAMATKCFEEKTEIADIPKWINDWVAQRGILTLQMLKDMEPETIFAKGKILNKELPTPMVNPSEYPNLNLCWVAKRGEYWDWAVYIGRADMGYKYAENNGDKPISENNIRFLVPCDNEAYKMFRY